VSFAGNTQTIVTLFKTTNSVQCHTSTVKKISSETFMFQLYQRYTYMAKNMKMGEVTTQHIFYYTYTLSALEKFTSFYTTGRVVYILSAGC